MASASGSLGEQEDPKDVGGGEEQKLPELKLDARQAQGFISFFNKLPPGPEIVRFFDRRDYFTVHGDNATLVARTYYKTMTCLRQLGNPPDTLMGVSVSRSMFETIIRDLLLQRTDHIVEVYEGSGSNWRLVKTGTPGNLRSFEDVLFSSNEMEDTPVLMALYPTMERDEILLGVAFVDMTKRTLGMTQFLDDDQFTNLDSAMTALGCKECLIPQDGANRRRLSDVFLRCNVLLRERKRAEFKPRDVEQDLARLVKGSQEQVHGIKDLEAASAAMAALLSYTEMLSNDSAYGKYTLQQYKLDTYMRLDAAALQALNVFESRMDLNKNFSVAGLMNRTCTAGMGKRLLNRWLKQPLLDIDEINQRLDIVQTFVERVDLRQDVQKQLKRIPDLERLLRKVERRKATLFDIVKLFQVSMRLPFIKEALAQYDGESASVLKEKYINDMEEWTGPDHLGKFDGLVEAAIDLDHVNEGEYVIDPEYDPALGELRAERNKVEEQITKVYKQAISDLDLTDKTLKLDKAAQLGHVFRITKKEEPRVRKKLNMQYVTLETRKDGIKFTNANLRKLSEQFQKLTDEYEDRQRELVEKVVEVAATFLEIFEGVANLLAELDVLLGFADLSVSAPTVYVRPSITSSSEGDIILEGSRHPCVEVQEDVSFIPNDCRLVRGKSWFQIITGPNMGGKSTFIRQVGVVVLMAQVGCFVPCDRAEISVRDSIFARVGAGDCQLRGVSTFMAEMLETASILKAATDRSLIIIDELGRGTSTYDGFGLAWGICEYLTEVIRAPCLFATHFHELTALATSQGPPVHGPPRGPPVGITNYHVSAHIDQASRKLTMLFKVEDGPCDQSFGIHVAEFAHFPADVVEMARKKAEQLEQFSSPADELPGGKEVNMSGRQGGDPSEDARRGMVRVRKYLRDVRDLPEDMPRPDLAAAMVELLNHLEADSRSNAWLRELLISLQPEN